MEKKEFGSHISNQLNQNLEALFNHILEMGGMVESQLDSVLVALADGDVKMAKKVLRMDTAINQAEVEIDRLCASVLARQQPTASDLRLILSTIRIAVDLERMGDELVKIAGMVIGFSKSENGNLCRGLKGYDSLVDISQRSRKMLNVTLNAFARVSIEEALNVMEDEETIDELYKVACDELISRLKTEPENAECFLEIISGLRASERLSDHALNIMETIIYLVEGQDIRNMDQARLVEFLEKMSKEV